MELDGFLPPLCACKSQEQCISVAWTGVASVLGGYAPNCMGTECMWGSERNQGLCVYREAMSTDIFEGRGGDVRCMPRSVTACDAVHGREWVVPSVCGKWGFCIALCVWQ